MAGRNSAAWTLAIVAVLVTAIVGPLLLTMLDPVMQALFASSLWDCSTSYCTNALSWQKSAWTYWAAMILFGVMVLVWIRTRQPA